MKKLCTTMLIALMVASCASHKKAAVQTNTETTDMRLGKVEAVTITNDSTDETLTFQMVEGGGAVRIEPQGAISIAGVKSIKGNKKRRQNKKEVAKTEDLHQMAYTAHADSVAEASEINEPEKPPNASKTALQKIVDGFTWAVFVCLLIGGGYGLYRLKKRVSL